MPQTANLNRSLRVGGASVPTARLRRPHRALTGALAAALLAGLTACGNLMETAGCKASCEDAERQCLLYGALANQTPSNDPAPNSVLFLNCRSAFYVCRASCDEGATRL